MSSSHTEERVTITCPKCRKEFEEEARRLKDEIDPVCPFCRYHAFVSKPARDEVLRKLAELGF